MAGVLATLLIVIYCIYIRQHKEDMFSHHRLYGEGFEDPVLHLDTPVDHFDFFSFRDTEFTPAPTPRHTAQNTVPHEPKLDYGVEAPKGTSSNEHPGQIIQMGSLNIM
ncbi:Golgi-associated olfactory signaling regulator [Pelodytes ibericus]